MERTDWPPMDEKTLLEILNKFDKNKNGFIDYNSFLTGTEVYGTLPHCPVLYYIE